MFKLGSVVLCMVGTISAANALESWKYSAKNRKYYCVIGKKVSQAEAASLCADMGARLPTIHTTNEMVEFDKVMEDFQSPTVWSSASRNDEGNMFSWDDGTPVREELWAVGEPKNSSPDDKYVSITKVPWTKRDIYSLDDVGLKEQYMIACEKDELEMGGSEKRMLFWSLVDKDVIYRDHVTTTVRDVDTVMECIVHCQNSRDCNSVLYLADQTTCYYHFRKLGAFTGQSSPLAGAVFYQ